MAINLAKAAKDVDFGDAAYVPLLDNLQANILASHGRDHARHLFIPLYRPGRRGARVDQDEGIAERHLGRAAAPAEPGPDHGRGGPDRRSTAG